MKNNKSLIALLLVAIIGVVGLTFAYFSNQTTIENEFTTKEYGTSYEEEFVSPANWLPGDTTEKTVIATNTGQVDQAVRISLTESWTPANEGASLNGWIHADGTKSTHTTETELANDERVAVINFVDPSDWTKVGDYYYYNYKLAPSESTTSLIESVTFNSKTKLDDTCVTTVDNGVRTITCNSSGNDYDHATYKLTINIETVQYNKYNEAWGLNNTVTIAEEKPHPLSVTEFVSNETNPSGKKFTDSDSDKGKMFTFTHILGNKTETEYRYIGDVPDNYVYFNCDEPQEGVEYNYATNCEIWRIVGVFNVDDGTGNIEPRMKIIKNVYINDVFKFDLNHGTYGANDWTVSDLKDFLNGDYYSRTGKASSYGLKNSARGMISNAKFYLGALSYDNGFGSVEKIYGEERGNVLCGSCGTDTTKLTWTGKVALIYPSDHYMVYANGVNNNCYTNTLCIDDDAETGWIYNDNSSYYNTWLLGSRAGNDNLTTSSATTGALATYTAYQENLIRPSVYLSADVLIDGGTGTQLDPYTLTK